MVCTSCWRNMRNKTSEGSKQVRFLIQKQRVLKYRTVQSTFHVFCVYIEIPPSVSLIIFYFKSFKKYAKMTWWNHNVKKTSFGDSEWRYHLSCMWEMLFALQIVCDSLAYEIYNIAFQCQSISLRQNPSGNWVILIFSRQKPCIRII